MEVHGTLAPEFLESEYQKSLAHQMNHRGIPYEQLVTLPIKYKQFQVGDYKADFVVADGMIVEIKTIISFASAHEAQALYYLAATRSPSEN